MQNKAKTSAELYETGSVFPLPREDSQIPLASPEERAAAAWAAGEVQTLYPGNDFHKALAAAVESGPLGNEVDRTGLTIDDIIELLQEFKAQAGNLRTTVSAIGTPGGNGALRFITLRPDTVMIKAASVYMSGDPLTGK